MTRAGVISKVVNVLLFFVLSIPSVMACDIPEGWLQMQSNEKARHILWIHPDDEAYQQGHRFGADVIVCSDNVKTAVEEINIDAIMPAHKHGTNYLPEIILNEQANQLRASGLFFHMPGQWQITVTLRQSADPERHTLTLVVK